MKEFIELNRTFYQLAAEFSNAAKNDDISLREGLHYWNGNGSVWEELVKEYRVIILAEAGAGKTSEIRNMTRRLRAEGKCAFFLRLEHITTGLDVAFEEGNSYEFKDWLDSNSEGWVLLDSVDEARLKDVKDFERAIKRLSVELGKAKNRTHIFITSRITAWRPKSDLTICNSLFPLFEKSETEFLGLGYSIKQSLNSLHPQIRDEVKLEVGFKVWTLVDLTRKQVHSFLEANGIIEPNGFLEEMDRHDAWGFASRPQDLEELVSFWSLKNRMGSRLELIRHSIERRLRERDQDRADSKPLSSDIARKGIQLLAAACIFTKKSIIRVPDGFTEADGLDVQKILYGWDDVSCQTLLSRPIFDEAIYGNVRFHHRSVREYLAAEWISERLNENGSRKKIEDLFFRNQYGRMVIVTSLKPVLSWLVLLDAKMLDKVNNLDPKVILEDGDSSQLPLFMKKQILHRICVGIANNTSSHLIAESTAVQRFATQELANDVKLLLQKYADCENVISYLLRIIWQGRIRQLLNDVMAIALNSEKADFTRVDAIRSLVAIGSKETIPIFLTQFINEKKKYSRTVVAEILSILDPSESSVDLLFVVIKNLESKDDSHYDGLDHSLQRFVGRLERDTSRKFIECAYELLKCEPLVERNYCEISEQFVWIIPYCTQIIERLLITKESSVLSNENLSILAIMPLFKDLYELEPAALKYDIRQLIIEWSEVNYKLFWKYVDEVRKGLKKKSGVCINNIWQLSIGGRYWDIDSMDFQQLIIDIKERSLMDDRKLALSFAFKLYVNNKRPRAMLASLKQSIIGDSELKASFELLLRPLAEPKEIKDLKRKQARWLQQEKKLEKKKAFEHEGWVKWLNENTNLLRNNNLGKGEIINAQCYLFEKMSRKAIMGTSLTTGNWQLLIDDYGLTVAIAFREGLLGFWRNNTPELRSETDYGNKIEFGVRFGLSGIYIESKEVSNWPNTLSESEAELACRYAFREINNFPDWFESLCNVFPKVVYRMVLNEVLWELTTAVKAESQYYILNIISSGNSWLWDGIANQLLNMLKTEPLSHDALTLALKVIQYSTVIKEEELCEISSIKCNSEIPLWHQPNWFAAWIGVSPKPAIKALSLRLVDLNDEVSSSEFAMKTIVYLMGERRSRASSRNCYGEPECLKSLYLLMHQYIRTSEDISRAGKGAYSPMLRDDAQDARERLLSMLSEIPGKETYLAMLELSILLPSEIQRKRALLFAEDRANLDAEFFPWSAEKFVEFNKCLESVPRNQYELFDLAVQRLIDLKHDLEDGDESIASTLAKENEERGMRKYIAGWCRDRSSGRYIVAQEEELADARRPDCRFIGSLFDGTVPVELKLAQKWTGAELFESLENQLCAGYLRDYRSNFGIFILVYSGGRDSWKTSIERSLTFSELINSLQEHWEKISCNFPKVEEIKVIGIDLTKRSANSTGQFRQ